MIIDRITHSESFEYYDPSTGLKGWRKTEMSGSITPDEDPLEETKKLRDKIIQSFKTNPTTETNTYSTPPPPVEEQVDIDIQKRFDELQRKLNDIETREEAKLVLEQSEFRLNIDLKRIVNSKIK